MEESRQNTTQQTPEKTPAEEPKPIRHVSHTYQDDLSQAMNATEPTVIQELLHEAHEREEDQKITSKNNRERKWYTATSLTLLAIAAVALGYGVYHYARLTVPVSQKISVGVFPSTQSFVANTIDVPGIIEQLKNDTTIKTDTPYLVPIVQSDNPSALLTNQQLFAYLQTAASEPFVGAFDSVRLGVMRESTSDTLIPFFIGSVADPVVTTKEFLIAEPKLLNMFFQTLNIKVSEIPAQIGNTFSQQYRFNLPVRILSYTDQSGLVKELFLYGFVTNNVIVITTDAQVLEAVSNSIIRQQ